MLLDRERQTSEAVTLLATKARQSNSYICELTIANISEVLTREFASDLSGALVLHITAPFGVRASRNESRGALRMPDELLDSIPGSVSSRDQEALRGFGAEFKELDTVGELRDAENRICKIVEVYLIG